MNMSSYLTTRGNLIQVSVEAGCFEGWLDKFELNSRSETHLFTV